MSPNDPRGDPELPRRHGTVLESVEEIREQIRRPGTLKEPIPTQDWKPAEETQPFRPTQRPSMAVLCVLDDGEDSGEMVRIRGDSFVIGRVAGDRIIPHDGGISGRHAEITRRLEGGHYRWYLRDLQSTNGTFVRAANGLLRPEQELLLGGIRLRFDAASMGATAEASEAGGGAAGSTRKWQAPSQAELADALHPALVELTPEGEGKRFRLDRPEQWAGRDPRQCSVVLDHPMVSPRHAKVHRDDRGRWFIQNEKSLNGLWMRVTEIPLDRGGQFQCGEQRFAIKVL